MPCLMARQCMQPPEAWKVGAGLRAGLSTLRDAQKLSLRKIYDRMSRGASTAIRASDGTLAAALNPPKVVVLSGPTSVGKTEASLRLAKLLDCEIISADSVQVYRGLDVGSDKIPVEKRGGIPHHLIDIFDPYTEEFSAGSFYNHAHKAVAEILARGKTPLVVGGTGFYLKMFMDGKPSAEAATPEVVQEVENRLDQAFRAAETEEGAALDDAKRWAVGLQQLVALGDPAAAERIRGERNNWYRLKRAMEVLLMTGRPRADALLPAAQVRPADAERVRQLDFRCFYLHRPRAQIFERILLRTEHMVCAGLLQEAADLLQNGMQAGSRAAARAIGYRQALKYLTEVCEGGAAPEAGHLQQLVLDIATASRRLVKNQLTWFRDDEQYLWVDAEAGPEAVAAHIAQQVQLERHQGGCGNSGRLSKEEQYTSMVYQPELKILNQPEQLQLVLQQVAELKQRLAHSKQSTSSTASSD